MKIKLFFSLLFCALLQQCSTSNTLNIAKKAEKISHHHRFVIVTPSYNNALYYERNLSSIFSQDYEHFRVIYIDDSSTDSTYEDVKRYIETQSVAHKVELIHNATNQKALYNLYTAIHSCKDEEIVVILDGDDWFANNHVLSDLNRYYTNKNVWLTYGQYVRYPDAEAGLCKPVTHDYLKAAKMRSGPWLYSHLRTFYAGLFKKIRLEDLTENGQFFSVTYDLAIMFPMLEMARKHAFFTPDTFYVYNWENPITDQKIREKEQLRIENLLRQHPIYPALTSHPAKPLLQEECDLIVFSYNRPMQLYAFLESTEKHVQGLRKIGILFRSDEEFKQSYEVVRRRFPHVQFFQQPAENPKSHFKPMLLNLLFGKFGRGASHVIFAVDDIIVTEPINISQDIMTMARTNAYGFYYRLGKNIDSCYMLKLYHHPTPRWVDLGNDTYTWEFQQGEGDWCYPHSVDFTIFRKQDIKKDFEELNYSIPNELEGRWSNRANLRHLGLCHAHSKIINIPMNLVTEFNNINAGSFTIRELNKMFSEGLKIDIQAMTHFENISPHVAVNPPFTTRN